MPRSFCQNKKHKDGTNPGKISSKGNLNRDKSLSFVLASTVALSLFLMLGSSIEAKNTTSDTVKNRGNETKPFKATSATSPEDSNAAIYHKLGVRLPHDSTKVLKTGFGIEFPLARWSWKIHGRLLPLLHFFDKGRPDDVFVNLRVLWCKLLISLDPRSIAYEGRRARHWAENQNSNVVGNSLQAMKDLQLYATYRMLPPYSIKWALRHLGLWRIFPRWMHANIELRIVYLQTALEKVLGSRQSAHNNVNNVDGNSTPIVDKNSFKNGEEPCLEGSTAVKDEEGIISERICVIILGGGYDPRGAKLSVSDGRWPHTNVERVYELDLPEVIDSKHRLLLRAGFDVIDDESGNHKYGNSTDDTFDDNRKGVRLEGVNLNDDVAVDRVLDKIRQELIKLGAPTPMTKDSTLATGKSKWHIVLISEAVFLYLDPGKAERIVEGVANRFRTESCGKKHETCFSGASFVFADRLLRCSTTGNSRAKTTTRQGMSVPVSSDLIEIEQSEVRRWLGDRGWQLNELLLKPGATRHLGIATTP